MSQENLLHKESFRDIFDLYFGKWKIIALSLFLAVVVAFIYLRYSTKQYESAASIMLKDNSENNSLSEITALQEYGLFSNNATNVQDEMKILESRTILRKVVK